MPARVLAAASHTGARSPPVPPGRRPVPARVLTAAASQVGAASHAGARSPPVPPARRPVPARVLAAAASHAGACSPMLPPTPLLDTLRLLACLPARRATALRLPARRATTVASPHLAPGARGEQRVLHGEQLQDTAASATTNSTQMEGVQEPANGGSWKCAGIKEGGKKKKKESKEKKKKGKEKKCPLTAVPCAVYICHVGLTYGSHCQKRCQFDLKLRFVRIATNLPNSGHILKKKHKVVVFRNLT